MSTCNTAHSELQPDYFSYTHEYRMAIFARSAELVRYFTANSKPGCKGLPTKIAYSQKTRVEAYDSSSSSMSHNDRGIQKYARNMNCTTPPSDGECSLPEIVSPMETIFPQAIILYDGFRCRDWVQLQQSYGKTYKTIWKHKPIWIMTSKQTRLRLFRLQLRNPRERQEKEER